MDKKDEKIVSILLDLIFLAMAELKNGEYKKASNSLWDVVRKIDALMVVKSLEKKP